MDSLPLSPAKATKECALSRTAAAADEGGTNEVRQVNRATATANTTTSVVLIAVTAKVTGHRWLAITTTMLKTTTTE